jgi:hypothetical protein
MALIQVVIGWCSKGVESIGQFEFLQRIFAEGSRGEYVRWFQVGFGRQGKGKSLDLYGASLFTYYWKKWAYHQAFTQHEFMMNKQIWEHTFECSLPNVHTLLSTTGPSTYLLLLPSEKMEKAH